MGARKVCYLSGLRLLKLNPHRRAPDCEMSHLRPWMIEDMTCPKSAAASQRSAVTFQPLGVRPAGLSAHALQNAGALEPCLSVRAHRAVGPDQSFHVVKRGVLVVEIGGVKSGASHGRPRVDGGSDRGRSVIPAARAFGTRVGGSRHSPRSVSTTPCIQLPTPTGCTGPRSGHQPLANASDS